MNSALLSGDCPRCDAVGISRGFGRRSRGRRNQQVVTNWRGNDNECRSLDEFVSAYETTEAELRDWYPPSAIAAKNLKQMSPSDSSIVCKIYWKKGSIWKGGCYGQMQGY